MGELRHFKSKATKLDEFINEISKTIKDDAAEFVLITYKDKGGHWVAGRFNLNCFQMAEAVAHLQVDLMDLVIRTNPERYGLHEHF